MWLQPVPFHSGLTEEPTHANTHRVKPVLTIQQVLVTVHPLTTEFGVYFYSHINLEVLGVVGEALQLQVQFNTKYESIPINDLSTVWCIHASVPEVHTTHSSVQVRN